MSSVIAIVKSIIGQVFALSADGVQRLLVEGDRLFAGEQVMTGATGMLTLQLADGRSLDLGRDSQWSAESSSAQAAAAQPVTGTSADELVQAIAAGLDPTAELPATAAGGAGGGTGGAGGIGGGHSFVALDATAQRLDPTVGYPTAGLDFAAERVDERIGAADDGTNGNAPADANTVAPLVPIAPVAVDDMGSRVSEDGSISIDVLGNDSDSDGTLNPASVQITGTTNPGDSLVVAGQGTWSVNTSTGAISFTPRPDYTGPVTSITYSVADNDGLRSNTATVDMLINNPNIDAPDATVTLGAVTTTNTIITAANVTSTSLGFTVSATNLDGSLGTISMRNSGTPTGFGVTGAASGANSEIGQAAGKSEQLNIEFNTGVTSATIRFAWLSASERAEYKLFDSHGNQIGGAVVKGVTDNIDAPITLTSTNGALIHRIEFTAPSGGDNDYLIHDITFASSTTQPIAVTVTPSDIGFESISAISLSIPEGSSLSVGTKNADGTWTLPTTSGGGYSIEEDPATRTVTASGLTMTTPSNVTGTPNVVVIASVFDGTNTVKAFIGSAGNDLVNGTAGDDILRGGLGKDELTGGSGADRFIWRAGDTGKDDVIKDFNTGQGDRIDLHDLLQGENDSNILNYLRVDTATSTLLVSSTGVLDATGSNADVSIKLENGSGGNFNINPGSLSQADLVNSLIAGADSIIKVDH